LAEGFLQINMTSNGITMPKIFSSPTTSSSIRDGEVQLNLPWLRRDKYVISLDYMQNSVTKVSTSPEIQILLSAACLCFNPGFYNALAVSRLAFNFTSFINIDKLLGAGGGQPTSAAMANTANAVLYGVFAVTAIGAGSLLKVVGPRQTLLFGYTGYPLFSGAMWYFSETGHLWYPVFAGSYLDLAAACLWTTPLFKANGYSEENEKARWRAIQRIFNMGGATIGSRYSIGNILERNDEQCSAISIYCHSLFSNAIPQDLHFWSFPQRN
jgi:hypothetical protein